MTIGYYNISYGEGFEGIINYVNVITDGWFVNLFILFIFVITLFVLSKSEWKMSAALSFAFLLTFITTMMMRLFTDVNGYILFISIIGLAISVLVGMMDKR